MDNQPQQNKPGGYGKRPLWFWILIYVVIAIIVYGLVYLLFFQSNTGGNFNY